MMLAAQLSFLAFLYPLNFVRAQTAQPAPGQPQPGPVGQFVIIGNSLVSGQQLFLGTPDRIYLLDKVENNPAQIDGHPAWASEWSLSSNAQRPLDAITNTFCAGGNVLGNGTWLNVGGNQAVTFGGEPAASQNGGGPYDDPDGRNSMRLLTPCEDSTCDWVLSPQQSTQRWYPTLETLEDGTIIILGGCENGGYVNSADQDNPTYEYFPSRGDPMTSTILSSTLPANLYPLTWLLPSGNLLIQSNWATTILDYKHDMETPIDDIPDAVRVYPASGGSVMLPLTPRNNYTATIMFCGGSNVQPKQWTSSSFRPVTYPASSSCVKIKPDISGSYTQEDPLPVARSMANLVALPNGKILALNGARLGTAGYGNNSWAIGQSYADAPVLQPAIFDPSMPSGSRWSTSGMQPSTVPRMYHSSALLLPDGSVIVSGSNPNSDYNVGPGIKYPTEYRTEIFYPSYYNQRRPQPEGIPFQLSYGGPSFDITLSSDDLSGDATNANKTKVIIIRPGFSTHAMSMGQRFVELATTYTAYQENNTAVIHVSQLPPNPAIIAPGPALLFVVVKGVPSIGLQVMLGSGKIGTQPILAASDLPPSSMVAPDVVTKPLGSQTGSNTKNGAASLHLPAFWNAFAVILSLAAAALCS